MVLPREEHLSLDVVASSFSADFGEIEKIWFLSGPDSLSLTGFPESLVIDFFDSRSPLQVLRRLETLLGRIAQSGSP